MTIGYKQNKTFRNVYISDRVVDEKTMVAVGDRLVLEAGVYVDALDQACTAVVVKVGRQTKGFISVRIQINGELIVPTSGPIGGSLRAMNAPEPDIVEPEVADAVG